MVSGLSLNLISTLLTRYGLYLLEMLSYQDRPLERALVGAHTRRMRAVPRLLRIVDLLFLDADEHLGEEITIKVLP